MINVNLPFLPPKEDFDIFISRIWNLHRLTNDGPLVKELETKLKELLVVNNLLFVTNGTLALQLAIKALELHGDVITTPFTYVATTSSIVWEGCRPVFVDVDKDSLNIDSSKIEEAITEKTTAIVATHVFGNPCDVKNIEKIANKYGLKVIYDAAHAFGVKVNGDSIFNYGNISTCSLHATKTFHTGEGGLVITKDPKLFKDLAHMRNFGHDGPENYYNLGINGKNSEFHAAMGLANLNYIQDIYNRRKMLSERYDQKLNKFKGVKPLWHKGSKPNYTYYPIIFENESLLLRCIELLERNDIFGRRYFYPPLSQCLPYLDTRKFEYVDNLSKRVFCLPLYYNLSVKEIDFICEILMSA